MNQIVFVIDSGLLEKYNECEFPPLDVAAKERGHIVIYGSYKPFSSNLDDVLLDEVEKYAEKYPVVAFGTIGFMRQFTKSRVAKKICPGAYYKTERLKYSVYASYFKEKMLNNDFIMLPWGEIERRGKSFFGSKFFIRPDVVTKSFAGKVVDFNDISENPYALSKYEMVDPEELCVIARPKEIKEESRHLIVNGKWITGSTYNKDGNFDLSTENHPSALELVSSIAKGDYRTDYAEIVDVAVLYDDTARIIEFNALSCSGNYYMNTFKIVESVAEMAYKEFTGDLD